MEISFLKNNKDISWDPSGRLYFFSFKSLIQAANLQPKRRPSYLWHRNIGTFFKKLINLLQATREKEKIKHTIQYSI